MKRLPRKIKKIAKSCIDYGSTESYIHAWYASERDKKLPNFGIVFLLTKSKRPYFYRKILFSKKIRQAYEDGMFDF